MKIRHRYLTQATFNALGSKDPGTLYHIEDTQAIYRGSTPIVISSDKINTSSSSQTKAGNLTIGGTLTLQNALSVTSGGTGKNSIASGSMLYASGANVLSEVVTTAFGRGLLNTASGSAVTGLFSEAATKLVTARNISLGTAVSSTPTGFNGTSDISIPITGISESYLTWGGKNIAGGYAPIDAAMVPVLGANRLAFMNPSATIFEYSRDGGVTWIPYDLPDHTKVNLFNGNISDIRIGGGGYPAGTDYTNFQVRVTINTSAAPLYTVLNKFVILISTNGSSGAWCTIDGRLQSNYVNNIDTWAVFANKAPVSGWSGYNVINTLGITTYGNNTTVQYGQVRFTFGNTGYSTTYTGLCIFKILGFGGVGWTTPSTLAASGLIYTYDSNKNVYFPAGVTATTGSFSSSLTLSYLPGEYIPYINSSKILSKSPIYTNGTMIGVGNPVATGTGLLEIGATKNAPDTGIAIYKSDASYSSVRHWINAAGDYVITRGDNETLGVNLATSGLFTVRAKFKSDGESRLIGSVIIGEDATPGAKMEIVSTGENLRLSYNQSIYSSFNTDSNGNLIIDNTGTFINIVKGINVRTTANTYRDKNTDPDSAPMPFVVSGYSGKYQGVDGGTVSQSWNFIQENTAGNRIRYANINAYMLQNTAGAEKGVIRFFTKTAEAGVVEALRIDDIQNVLIGTTTNPASHRLVVSGSGYFSSNLSVMGSLTVSGSITASAFYQSA